jgi:hypothetical protein
LVGGVSLSLASPRSLFACPFKTTGIKEPPCTPLSILIHQFT